MTHALTLAPLRHHPALLPEVADRIWQTWWRESGVSLDVLTDRLQEISTGGGAGARPEIGVPEAYVALFDGRYAASALLIPQDDDAFPQLTPWIAALWTEPALRGRGIAPKLMAELQARARAAGLPALYLGSRAEKIPFYKARGYRLITTTADGSGIFSFPLQHNWREEEASDAEQIAALTTAAFATAPHASGTEAAIVEKLRAGGELVVSLVLEAEGQILAHVAFSPVTIGGADLGWVGLGPVSVAPSHQGRGLGAALIREGLLWAQSRGAKGCVVLGDPRYYRRFGFEADPRLSYPGAPEPYFQTLSFEGYVPKGEVAYSPAFGA